MQLISLGFSMPRHGCPICHGPAFEFKDEISWRESQISGLCQECQDKIFSETDED